ncbi:DUF5655 domain-containing protein [Capnocytophaga sp.]|uniref:DUF5655 domain-containing protein n=1 Tax=Capnocytophaga sp. TaxID=44737 RepID=UPI0026DD9649|nr:DUF5655 domain-containing protein [Capnocytophaga sp.]MDO5106174.1 DUF5655 domain-containing protein [Capnocytophaga sp.]
MKIYHKIKNSLSDLKEIPFKLERDIQRLLEQNLEQITGLELVKSEFSVQEQRIDTLAFDVESKSFVIIEYKRSHNYSVFDQGVGYLRTLLQYKADFVLEYNEKLGKSLKKDEVDWSQSKVVFVSPAFNSHQKKAVDFKDLNIELWEIKQFEGDIITINGLRKSASAPSVKLSVQKENSQLQEITKELKTYTEKDLLNGKPDETLELYEEIKQAILNLSPEIEIVPQKHYVAFKMGKRNICDIEIQKKELKFFINKKYGELDDPKNLMQDVSKKGHLGNGDYATKITDLKNVEYLMSLVKQAV